MVRYVLVATLAAISVNLAFAEIHHGSFEMESILRGVLNSTTDSIRSVMDRTPSGHTGLVKRQAGCDSCSQWAATCQPIGTSNCVTWWRGCICDSNQLKLFTTCITQYLADAGTQYETLFQQFCAYNDAVLAAQDCTTYGTQLGSLGSICGSGVTTARGLATTTRTTSTTSTRTTSTSTSTSTPSIQVTAGNDNAKGPSSGPPIAAIAGGIAGGVAIVAIAVGLIIAYKKGAFGGKKNANAGTGYTPAPTGPGGAVGQSFVPANPGQPGGAPPPQPIPNQQYPPPNINYNNALPPQPLPPQPYANVPIAQYGVPQPQQQYAPNMVQQGAPQMYNQPSSYTVGNVGLVQGPPQSVSSYPTNSTSNISQPMSSPYVTYNSMAYPSSFGTASTGMLPNPQNGSGGLGGPMSRSTVMSGSTAVSNTTAVASVKLYDRIGGGGGQGVNIKSQANAFVGWTPQSNDELFASEGDVLFVETVFPDDWCYGHNITRGTAGVFPAAILGESPFGLAGAGNPSKIGPRVASVALGVSTGYVAGK